jgi:hypothetical protein
MEVGDVGDVGDLDCQNGSPDPQTTLKRREIVSHSPKA